MHGRARNVLPVRLGGDSDIPTGVCYILGRGADLAHILRDKKKMLNRVRRIRGQVESIENAIEREADCSDILHTISACRGAINSLMAEVLEGHIRFHVVDPDQHPTSERAKAAQELIDVLRSYLR